MSQKSATLHEGTSSLDKRVHDIEMPRHPLESQLMHLCWQQVTTKQLHQWCSLKGDIASFESSAKEAINVEQAFQEAARKALAQEMQHDQYNDFPDQIQLNANTPSQQSREGCSC